MKKILIHGFAVTVFAVTFSSASFAQADLVASASPAAAQKSYSTATKISAPVNTRVARSFYKNFRTTENIQWKETKTEYIAHFKAGDRFAMAWFSKTGELYSSSFYGTAKDLPDNEREMISNNFNGFEITATTEVAVKDATAWIVTIRSADQVKKVKLAEGGYEVIETMSRVK